MFVCVVGSVLAGTPKPASREPYVVVQPQRYPVPLSDVRLTGGPFLHAQEMDRRWLDSMDVERYLSGFRSEAGLPTKVPRYGGWESGGCSGHAFGHFLSAASMMYAATGDQLLLGKINDCIDALAECQQAEGTGLLAGFERSRAVFEELSRGDIRSHGFDLNEGWVPFYVLHKEFAGLVDVCRYTPNPKALSVLTRFADWLDNLVAKLSDEQMAQILICEHGGITEALADLYALTGQHKYLDLSRRFDHQAILHSLAAGVDSLPGKHANTQIPKIVGAVREYECTGVERYRKIADFFWQEVVNYHSYAIGGNSEHEHFGAPGMLANRLSGGTCETCNTYNMLKLTRHLYQIDPTVQRVDYYERALYNQILATQNADDGMVCYMSPMGSGNRKTYSAPFDSFWCCVGSGMENHARYGEFIYFTDARENLYVNLFIPSTLDWKSRDVKVEQITEFPYSDEVRLRVNMKKPQRFALNIRYPEWAINGCELMVNGQVIKHKTQPGSYITIQRTWRSGDQVSFVMRQSLHAEPILGDSTQRAYFYGPIVLSSVLDEKEEIPIVVADDLSDVETRVKCIDKDRLRFELTTSQPVRKELIPYYEVGGRRMMVYYRHFSRATWQQQLSDMRLREDREEWLREKTVSQFSPGEMQPERDHNFHGEKTTPHEYEGRKYRETQGGWFSFEMAVAPDLLNTLYCTYWGNRFYNHSFDIEIDGQKIGFENIHNWGAQY
ncbi:MAG: glycoside hydrolase family 127 protein, partial [Alistipes sp.]